MTIAIMSNFTCLLKPLPVAGVVLTGVDVGGDTWEVLPGGGFTCTWVIVGVEELFPT